MGKRRREVSAFLGGERRCPPEDCGGPPGYSEFTKQISSKQKRVRGEALRWYGAPYDPDDIDEAKIVCALGKGRTRKKPRAVSAGRKN